ncbi:uncharacterized protein LOC117100490 [Anneissia japonica]|uniref:uncharacterized protein LOC117100490 n=1 Tax=Anneissia japonica TaxID=1529436 RepID=UPI0014255C5F|nr:uncharacterized protein LOC117100490 [Anneissia japonica]XP_033096091.1 uncharacterized protein LOC117100490 [Anneissia japonica]
MRSPWISIIFYFILIASMCKGQGRAPKNSGATRSSTNDRITDARANRPTLKRKPDYHAPDQRSIFIKKIDELHKDLDEQKTVFVTHKRDFDDHIYSFERKFAVMTQGMQEMSNKMQLLLKKNLELENQIKTINEQFVLIPKEKVQIPQTEDEQGNRTQGRSASKSSIEEYLSNREAEFFYSLPLQPIKNSQKQKVNQRITTSSRSGNHKSYSQRNNSFNKQKKPDYITEAILRLFAQDKLNNDRLSTLELQLKAIDLAESVTTTIIVEACNETDSTTEILELKDMEKRVSDLEKNSLMKNNELKEEQTNMIVEARGAGRKKYKNEVLYDPRAASDARKSLFSVARKTPFYGNDKDFRTINLNHTFANKGKHFINNNTFVCQLNGFYFFTFTVRSLDYHTTYVALMKNKEVQTSISADRSDRNIMQTQSTILQMNQGDKVWLRVGPNSNFGLDSEESHKYITFSGFLIYKGS